MLKIGGRVGFDRLQEMEPHFKSIDFPIELARALGMENITIHPNLIKGGPRVPAQVGEKNDQATRTAHQKTALGYMKRLGGGEIFSIETFGGSRRLFTPQELMQQNLPMTLDVAHIHNGARMVGSGDPGIPSLASLSRQRRHPRPQRASCHGTNAETSSRIRSLPESAGAVRLSLNRSQVAWVRRGVSSPYIM